MKLIIFDRKKQTNKINVWFDWVIHMILYGLILITVSLIFKNTIYIDNSYFGIWALVTAIIIYFLNKTIKPIIIALTLPLTAITLGLFYPFINVIILHITDFILGKYFDINGIFMSFIVAVLISIMNILVEEMIIKPLVKKGA